MEAVRTDGLLCLSRCSFNCRKYRTNPRISFLAVILGDKFVGHAVGKERGIFWATHSDVDVESATVLETDGGCITVAETFENK